ncbi:MAG: o-succinylbenzoate synthase [bacterium]
MINIQPKIFRYYIPLKNDLILKGQAASFREGLILAFCENDKILALGEIAPLPGFSRETIEQAEEQTVRSIKNMPLDLVLPGLLDSPLIETMIEHAIESKLYPSVEFGLCTATLNLISHIKKVPVRKLLSENAADQININALLSGSVEEITEKTKQLIANGYSTFKLKVGRQNLDEDIELVRKVNYLIKDSGVLTLDANRAWSVDDALKFGKSINDIKVAYIEEPVKDYLGILQLSNNGKFKIPIALDESLAAIIPKAMEIIPGVTTLVLKPTIIGFVKTIAFNKQAKNLGMKTVISSSFESSIGLNALAEFASGFDASAGLDTIAWFAEDTLASSFEIKFGQVNLNEILEQKLNMESSHIQEISLV